MTVPIESIKPGTVWRFKSGYRCVLEINIWHVHWERPDGLREGWTRIRDFASHAIEQVTAPERVGGEG